LLPNYQNSCSGCNNDLDVMQGRHLGRRGLERSTDPQMIYDFSFFCKSYF